MKLQFIYNHGGNDPTLIIHYDESKLFDMGCFKDYNKPHKVAANTNSLSFFNSLLAY